MPIVHSLRDGKTRALIAKNAQKSATVSRLVISRRF